MEAGLAGQEDETQLEFAAEHSRLLYSFNVGHFCQLHGEWLSEGRNHTGIAVVPRQRYGVGEQLRRLLLLIATNSTEQMQNRLEFL